MPEPLDPTQWPRYVFHHTKEAVCVATPEEEAALGEGWRRTQYTPDEAREARKPLDRTKYPAVRREMEPPVPTAQEQRAVQKKAALVAAALEERSARRQEQLAKKRERQRVLTAKRRVEREMMADIERKREAERQEAEAAHAAAERRREEYAQTDPWREPARPKRRRR